VTAHLEEGTLRRLVDDPTGCDASDRDHVAGCATCRRAVDELASDAARVEAALAMDAGRIDVDAAWRRLTSDVATPAPVLPLRRRPPSRARRLLRRPAVAGIAVAAVLTGATAAAANDWFQIFEAERVQPVPITSSVLNALPDLAAYGDLTLTGSPDVRSVADAAAAEAATGLDVPVVAELPRGVEGEPRVQVGDEVSATFTFDAERAGGAAELDDSSFRLVAGPGVAQVWSQRSGVPVLLVGRATAPRAFSSSGVPFEAVRDHLLSLPDLPEDVAASLRSFDADGATFPLPVPAELATSGTTTIDGADATVLASSDRTMAAVVWVADGLVTVVAGALDTDEVVDVARGLR